MICMLLDNHANPNLALKEDGSTPLMVAAQDGHDAVCRTLISHGAKVNALRKDGVTALYLACMMGHAPVVSVLLHSGADTRATQLLDGSLAMHAAAKGRYVEICRMLLDHEHSKGM